MPIDYSAAKVLLQHASSLERGGGAVDPEWVGVVEQVASFEGWRTPVAVLGVVLLARSLDSSIDPFCLKAGAGGEGTYTPRTLCHGVLVPFAREAGYDLGVTGAEPFNNQPWFRYGRISEDMQVKNRPALLELIEILNTVATLDERMAFDALVAYLSARRVSPPSTGGGVGPANSLADLVRLVDSFLVHSEGGKRGQAYTAAVLDLVLDDVTMARINDPSRTAPGDVRSYSRGFAIEIKQKSVDALEIRHFASECERFGFDQAGYVALAPGQEWLDVDELERAALVDFGVLLTVMCTPLAVVRLALLGGLPVAEFLERFPTAYSKRLVDIEASRSTVEEWNSSFR